MLLDLYIPFNFLTQTPLFARKNLHKYKPQREVQRIMFATVFETLCQFWQPLMYAALIAMPFVASDLLFRKAAPPSPPDAAEVAVVFYRIAVHEDAYRILLMSDHHPDFPIVAKEIRDPVTDQEAVSELAEYIHLHTMAFGQVYLVTSDMPIQEIVLRSLLRGHLSMGRYRFLDVKNMADLNVPPPSSPGRKRKWSDIVDAYDLDTVEETVMQYKRVFDAVLQEEGLQKVAPDMDALYDRLRHGKVFKAASTSTSSSSSDESDSNSHEHMD